MPYQARIIAIVLVSLAAAAFLGPVPATAEFFNLLPLPAAGKYGNILIDRLSTKNGVKPAAFSHWLHREKYTCRVCHSELEFNMKVNTTEITEAANVAGKYCGACHNGKLAFGQEQCKKCHNGEIGRGEEKFTQLLLRPLVKTDYGDGINWVASLRKGTVAPLAYLKTQSKEPPYDRELSLEADWVKFPPAVFPHKTHTDWLACSNCHPDIFNIKKKTTLHFSMPLILKGEFCGVCHLSVAFPMNDCKRCHPAYTSKNAVR
jgi:c(7)-type cytochrome triheme protein